MHEECSFSGNKTWSSKFVDGLRTVKKLKFGKQVEKLLSSEVVKEFSKVSLLFQDCT